MVWITSVGTEIHWHERGELELDEVFADRIAHAWDAAAIERALAGIAGLTSQSPIEQRAGKQSYFYDGADVPGAVERALKRAGLCHRVVVSHARLLDVLAVDGGKGQALDHVARRLGLPRSAVYAAGDSGNDRDMLEHSVNGILVANAQDGLFADGGPPNLHRATRPHAGGVLEGLLVHRRARLSAATEEKVAA